MSSHNGSESESKRQTDKSNNFCSGRKKTTPLELCPHLGGVEVVTANELCKALHDLGILHSAFIHRLVIAMLLYAAVFWKESKYGNTTSPFPSFLSMALGHILLPVFSLVLLLCEMLLLY